MSLTVVSAGPMLTVQDRGRTGWRRFGVSTAGPMDSPSLALANALCANPPDAAAVEFAGVGGTFRAGRALRFAVTGGACDVRIDNRRVAPGESHRLASGEELRIGALDGAMWGYLAVAGGFVSPPVLGSRATHLRSGLGGVEGRALRSGDVLPVGPATGADVCLRPAVTLPGANVGAGSGPIRVVPGPQQDYFAADVMARLSGEDFIVTPQRDRMGMVLGGTVLPAVRGHDIVSDGTVPGSIQVPGSGQPIVLMAESQTTGGYPKIATVISADLPRLAQMATGTRLRFAALSREAAEDVWIDHARRLRAVLAGVLPKRDGPPSSEYLLSCDLIGGIFAPDEVVRSRPSGQQGGSA